MPVNNSRFATLVPRHDETALLKRVKTIAQGPLAAKVVEIDQNGYYPLDIMALLGEAGALDVHLSRSGSQIGAAIKAMAEVTRVCGATGFLIWCHMVCGLYLEHAPSPALHETLLATHSAGKTFGGTALSNPMKALAGIERMALTARAVDGGYAVSGTLPWVSHIAYGQYCGAMATFLNEAGEQEGELLFLLRLDEQVTLRPCPHFSGMEGTSTWSICLSDYFLPAQDVIAAPARPLVARIKAPFILLQVGMAAGVIQGAIDSIWEVEGQLGHVNRYLEDRPEALQRELDALVMRAMDLAERTDEQGKNYFLDVLDLRAHGSELSLRATQSALLHQGARGYLSSAAPQRRVREAHFVAIVTPAIKHLRAEMARLSAEELPV